MIGSFSLDFIVSFARYIPGFESRKFCEQKFRTKFWYNNSVEKVVWRQQAALGTPHERRQYVTLIYSSLDPDILCLFLTLTYSRYACFLYFFSLLRPKKISLLVLLSKYTPFLFLLLLLFINIRATVASQIPEPPCGWVLLLALKNYKWAQLIVSFCYLLENFALFPEKIDEQVVTVPYILLCKFPTSPYVTFCFNVLSAV